MKKIISIILACAMALSLTACGSESANGYLFLKKDLVAQEYGVAFRSGEDKLCEAVNAAMSVLAADGTFSEIAKRYLGETEITIEPDASALDDIDADDRELVVGVIAGNPPMTYTGISGSPAGFDVELAAAVCKKLGWEIEYRVMEYDPVAELEAGNVDCIWSGFTVTNAAEKRLTCSNTYLSYTQKLVTKDGGGYKSFGSLKGEKLAIPGSTAADALKSMEESSIPKDAELVEYDDYDACFVALDEGQVQGIVISSFAADWYAG